MSNRHFLRRDRVWNAALAARVFVALCGLVAGIGLLHPANLDAKDRAEPPSPPRPPRVLSFTAHDSEPGRIIVGSGLKLAPLGPLDKPGPRLLLMAGYSLREQDPRLGRRVSRPLGARALFGHEWHRGQTSLSLYAGASLVTNDQPVIAATRKRMRTGPAVLGEIWHTWRPGEWSGAGGFSAMTLMGDAANRSLYLRLRHGFDIGWRGVAFGPETSVSLGRRQRQRGLIVQDGWRKARFGVHLSGIPLTKRIRLGLAGGYEFADRGRSGAYVALTTMAQY